MTESEGSVKKANDLLHTVGVSKKEKDKIKEEKLQITKY